MKNISILFMILLPLLAFSQSRSVNISVNNGTTKMTVKQGDGPDFSMEYEGEITLNDDDSDVADISKGGFFEIRKSGFGSRRRVYIEKEGGQLVKTYYLGSKEMPFDPEGKKWLSEILLEVVRTTTLGAEKRVDRIFDKGGVKGVLEEVYQIESDHVSSHYLKLLLEKDITESGSKAILETVKNIDSDHHRADILTHNMKLFTSSSSVREEFITTVGGIDSDHHKAGILIEAIKTESIGNQELVALFAITDKIDSDHHKADILMELLDNQALGEDQLELFFAVTADIDSDHHKANILLKALDVSQNDSKSYKSLISSIGNIDSDHHKASILENLLDKALESNDVIEILELMDEQIPSAHHKSMLLQKVIMNDNLGEKIVEKVIQVTRGLDSDHSEGEVFNFLLSQDLSEADIIMVFTALQDIASSHTKTQVLISSAGMVKKGSQNLKDAYMQVVKSIESTNAKGQALEAIE